MSELKKSEGYFFKEAQAAPLHERGHAAMSEKIILLLEIKEGTKTSSNKFVS
jgi:hypothetical protein